MENYIVFKYPRQHHQLFNLVIACQLQTDQSKMTSTKYNSTNKGSLEFKKKLYVSGLKQSQVFVIITYYYLHVLGLLLQKYVGL